MILKEQFIQLKLGLNVVSATEHQGAPLDF